MTNTPRLSAVNFKLVTVLALIERIASSHGASTDLRSSARELWTSVDIATIACTLCTRTPHFWHFLLAALTRGASLVRSCVRLTLVGF
jgi:hypothetical protein